MCAYVGVFVVFFFVGLVLVFVCFGIFFCYCCLEALTMSRLQRELRTGIAAAALECIPQPVGRRLQGKGRNWFWLA